MTTLKQIKQAVSADQVSRLKDGTIMFREGYFYRHGRSGETFRDKIVAQLNQLGIAYDVLSYGDHYAAFRGSALLKNSSHFYVAIKLLD